MLIILVLILIAASYFLIGYILSFIIKDKDVLESLSTFIVIVIIISLVVYFKNIEYKEDIGKIKQYFNLTENEVKQLNENDIKDLKEKIYEIEIKNIKNKINEKYNFIKQ